MDAPVNKKKMNDMEEFSSTLFLLLLDGILDLSHLNVIIKI